MARLPLEGIRIVDFSIVWAGTYATIILGDMGAEIVRVDSLQHPDVNTRGQPQPTPQMMRTTTGYSYPNREAGDRPWDRNASFNYTGRHKFSFTVDLSRPKGREILARLAKVSDGVIDNNAARTLENLGLTYDFFREANPQIIMIQAPGYGMTGPYKYWKAYGANMEALSGHTWIRGYRDSDPSTTYSTFHADASTGASIAFAFMAALHHRQRTGEGAYVDMSQSENVANHLAQAFMDYSLNRRVMGPQGNRDPSMLQGVYRCRGEDDWLALSIEDDGQWQALCGVMGRTELAHDPRFADVASRSRHHDEADAIIAQWTADKDKYELMHRLQKEGVPATAVLAYKEVRHDPHVKARGLFEEVTHPLAGTHLYPGSGFKMSKTPLRIRRPAPTLGQHNEYVYKEILGISDEEYEELVREKHIGDTYLALDVGAD